MTEAAKFQGSLYHFNGIIRFICFYRDKGERGESFQAIF